MFNIDKSQTCATRTKITQPRAHRLRLIELKSFPLKFFCRHFLSVHSNSLISLIFAGFLFILSPWVSDLLQLKLLRRPSNAGHTSNGSKSSLFRNRYLVSSRNALSLQTTAGTLIDQTTAAREQRYVWHRCIDIFVRLEVMLVFCYKNMWYTKCPISTYPAEKITLAYYVCISW